MVENVFDEPFITPPLDLHTIKQRPIDLSLFNSKIQGRVVRNIILDSDRFYQPDKRKLRLFTSTGREIFYPYHILVEYGIILKPRRKSFLFSKPKTLRSQSLTDIEELTDHEKIVTACDNFIFAEKWAYFEKWPMPQVYATNLSGNKCLRSFSINFTNPNRDRVSNSKRSVSISSSSTVSCYTYIKIYDTYEVKLNHL